MGAANVATPPPIFSFSRAPTTDETLPSATVFPVAAVSSLVTAGTAEALRPTISEGWAKKAC